MARDATEVIHARDNWAGLHSYVAKRQDQVYGTGTAWQDCTTQLKGASVVFSATGPGGKYKWLSPKHTNVILYQPFSSQAFPLHA